MSLGQSFKMSLQSILSNKVRSFLTMLGIIIGVAAVMIMVSVVQGGNKASQEYYAAMGSNKSRSTPSATTAWTSPRTSIITV